MIPGKKFFKPARQQVLKEVLAPAGFALCRGGIYVRQTAKQAHVIDFQQSDFGARYYVNVGLHFGFLPSSISGGLWETDEFGILDCFMRARLEAVTRQG